MDLCHDETPSSPHVRTNWLHYNHDDYVCMSDRDNLFVDKYVRSMWWILRERWSAPDNKLGPSLDDLIAASQRR